MPPHSATRGETFFVGNDPKYRSGPIHCQNRPDAELIAHAPTDIADLLAEVAALRKWRGEAVGLLEDYEDDSRELANYADAEPMGERRSKHYQDQAESIAAFLAEDAAERAQDADQ